MEINGENSIRSRAVVAILVNQVHGCVTALIIELYALGGCFQGVFGKMRRHPDTATARKAAARIQQHFTGAAVFHLETRFIKNFEGCRMNGPHLLLI